MLAEKPLDLPWKVDSKSYKLAKRIMEEKVPLEKSFQRGVFLSFAKDCGVTVKTLNNVLYVLRKANILPSGGINLPLGKDNFFQGKDYSAPFSPRKVFPKGVEGQFRR